MIPKIEEKPVVSELSLVLFTFLLDPTVQVMLAALGVKVFDLGIGGLTKYYRNNPLYCMHQQPIHRNS